jgi:cupin fold WbuC family metalloprotein
MSQDLQSPEGPGVSKSRLPGVQEFDASYFNSLLAEAVASPRRRMHRNVHTRYDDPCQRLFNVLNDDSYIPPHRHLLEPRDEMILAVQGLAALIVFDDVGAVTGIVPFGSEAHGGGAAMAVGVEHAAGVWHTVVSLSPVCTLIELKAGPFNPNGAKEFARFAPDDGGSNAALELLCKWQTLARSGLVGAMVP